MAETGGHVLPNALKNAHQMLHSAYHAYQQCAGVKAKIKVTSNSVKRCCRKLPASATQYKKNETNLGPD